MSMDSSRWARIQEIFHHALELPHQDQSNYVKSACAGDEALLADVLSMLEEDSRTGSIIDKEFGPVLNTPAASLTAPFPAGGFGQYRIIRPLGEGGMGVVHLAQREDFGSLVAIKILRDGLLSPDRRQRFSREQKVLGKLDHPLIARIHDADVLDNGTPWFAMEYVPGQPITDYCRERNLSIEDRVRLFRSVCEAVQFAHQNGIIHCDLKPSNILVKADGTVKLLDFGIARQLQASDLELRTITALRPMTVPYASPEQVRGEPLGVQTDIYTLGVLLYELLTGQLPFDFSRRTQSEAEQIIQGCEPEPPSAVARRLSKVASGRHVLKLNQTAWAELDLLSLTAMHKDPGRRYLSVEKLIRDLDHFLKGEPLDARPDNLGYRVSKFVGRNRRILCVTAAACVLVIVLSIFLNRQAARIRQLEEKVSSRIVTVPVDREDDGGGNRHAQPFDGSARKSKPGGGGARERATKGQQETAAGTSMKTPSLADPPSPRTTADESRAPSGGSSSSAGANPVDSIPKTSLAEVRGIYRNETERELDLETNASTGLRFRLLAKTPFVDQQGRPIRDSQLHVGDQLLVTVKPADPETAVGVMLLHRANDEERKAAETFVQGKLLRAPLASDLKPRRSQAPNPPLEPASQPVSSPGTRGVSPPKVLRQVEAQYSEEARQAKVSGTVVLQFVVGIEGRASDFKILKHFGYGLDEKAIEAVQQWEFAPGMKDGRPVAVSASVEVNFRLI